MIEDLFSAVGKGRKQDYIPNYGLHPEILSGSILQLIFIKENQPVITQCLFNHEQFIPSCVP